MLTTEELKILGLVDISPSQCDDYGQLTSWTQQCIRHADVLLVFADSRESQAVTGFEERVEAASIRVTKELVLCHTENTR